jgi:transposase
MAHARRKIHDLHVKCKTARTTEALRRIGELYAIEAKIRGHAAEERKRVRQEKALPLLNSLEMWLRDWRATLSTQTETAKAINYFMNHWAALRYYCDDGIAEIDNNIAENALRGCCLGRNNAQPQIMRSLHRTARHERQCDAPCRDLWLAANCT